MKRIISIIMVTIIMVTVVGFTAEAKTRDERYDDIAFKIDELLLEAVMEQDWDKALKEEYKDDDINDPNFEVQISHCKLDGMTGIYDFTIRIKVEDEVMTVDSIVDLYGMTLNNVEDRISDSSICLNYYTFNDVRVSEKFAEFWLGQFVDDEDYDD